MEARVNGITLYYKKEGSGAPLILLHGNGEDHGRFENLGSKLREKFTVYSLDSRNHGRSTMTGDYSYEAMATDVTAFIRELGLHHVSVVGFSDGAIVALMAQLEVPGLFRQMALLGVNLSPDDFRPEIKSKLTEAYEKSGKPLLKLMLEQPNIEIGIMATVTIPVLVAAGDNDIFIPTTFERVADALPDSRLAVFPGHDHFSYIDGSEEFYRILEDFLLSHR